MLQIMFNGRASGSARTRWGSLQRSPDPLTGLRCPHSITESLLYCGALFKGREKGKGGEGRGGENLPPLNFPSWGLDSQVGSVVRQSAKVTGSIPAAQKCWVQMEFVNIYQFRFHPMLKYACVYCVRFVLINLQHCGQPWRWLVAAYRPC